MAKKEKEIEQGAAEGQNSGPRKIKVTEEQLDKLQRDGQLIGYDPATQIALIK